METGKIVLDVTDEDIDCGVGENPHSCAIARSIHRLPGHPVAAVTPITARIGRRQFWTTPAMAEFICAFDRYKTGRGLRPEPTTFVLNCESGWSDDD